MRRFSPVLALVALVALLRGVVARRLGRRRDEANVRRLAEHLGSSVDDARRVYQLSREHGFGAAHTAVFGRDETGRSDQASSPERSVAEMGDPDGDADPTLSGAAAPAAAGEAAGG